MGVEGGILKLKWETWVLARDGFLGSTLGNFPREEAMDVRYPLLGPQGKQDRMFNTETYASGEEKGTEGNFSIIRGKGIYSMGVK